MVTLPYVENGSTRVFQAEVAQDRLQWHWDEQDRYVIAQHETDWHFQYDNALPQPLLKDMAYYIPAGVWHRLIKGAGSLSLTVLKRGIDFD